VVADGSVTVKKEFRVQARAMSKFTAASRLKDPIHINYAFYYTILYIPSLIMIVNSDYQ